MTRSVLTILISSLLVAAQALAASPEWISTTDGAAAGSTEIGGAASRAFIASEDGRFVVFSKSTPNGSEPLGSLYLRDRQLATTELVSVAVDGGVNDGYCQRAVISGDGRFVVFQSTATNLVERDENERADIFLRDRALGTTRLLSRNLAGDGGGDNHSWMLTASRNAEVIVFYSYASNLTPHPLGEPGPELYAHDRRTGVTTLLTLGYTGVGQGVDSFVPLAEISDDGRRVAFLAVGDQMVPGDDNGKRDIFVRDLVDGTLRLASRRDQDGGTGNAGATLPNISADGRYVFFNSLASDLVEGDDNADWDLFRLDTEADELAVVTSDESGRPAIGFAPSPYGPYAPPIDAAGDRIAFLTPSDLDPLDRNGEMDLYVKDMSTGRLFWIDVGDRRPINIWFLRPELDASGRHLFFQGPLGGPTPSWQFVHNLDTGQRRPLGRPVLQEAFLTMPLAASNLLLFLTDAGLDPGDDDTEFDLYAFELPPFRHAR